MVHNWSPSAISVSLIMGADVKTQHVERWSDQWNRAMNTASNRKHHHPPVGNKPTNQPHPTSYLHSTHRSATNQPITPHRLPTLHTPVSDKPTNQPALTRYPHSTHDATKFETLTPPATCTPHTGWWQTNQPHPTGYLHATHDATKFEMLTPLLLSDAAWAFVFARRYPVKDRIAQFIQSFIQYQSKLDLFFVRLQNV
jgi:hypothetical protein